MEITGKVIKILEQTSYVSPKNGNTYVTIMFVVETGGQYPKRIAFKVFGEEKFRQLCISVGGSYSFSFDIDSREWKGKWFTECLVWKAVSMDDVQQQQSSQPQQQFSPQADADVSSQSAPSSNESGALPF